MHSLGEHMTEENLKEFEYVDKYSSFGINIVSHKTKIAKITYILLLLYKVDLLTTIWALNTFNAFKSDILTHLKNYWITYAIALGLSFSMILMISEARRCEFYLMIPVKMFFVQALNLGFALVIFQLSQLFPARGYEYGVLLGHHFLMFLFTIKMESFKIRVFYINCLVTMVGITVVVFSKAFQFQRPLFMLLFLAHYFLVNCFYFLLINFFGVFHSKKFINFRLTLCSLIIYILANLTPLTILLVICWIFYLIGLRCVQKDRFYSQDSFKADVYSSRT